MEEHLSTAEVRGNVEGFLRASFGGAPVDQDDDFVVRRDGVVAWVRTIALPDGQTAVVVWSASNADFRIDPELTHYLATEGNGLDFAQFRLFESPSSRLHVSHALLGDRLSRDELEVAVVAVTSAASRYGPIVEERFGGRRFGDGLPGSAPGTVTVARPTSPTPPTPPFSPFSTSDQVLADSLLRVVLGAGGTPGEQRKRERATRLQAIFGIVAVAVGAAAAWFAYRESSSWALAGYVFLVGVYLVARGLPDLITDDQKVRRLLYFVTMPVAATGVLVLTHMWWDRWWLSVLLALTVGLLLGAVLSFLLFPRIAEEEAEDDRRRREAARHN
jgi:hypothetical protein